VDDDQLALGKRFFQIENEEIFLLLRNAEIRNKRDPQPDFRQIDEQIIAAQFNLRYQIQLVLLKHAVQKFAGSAFAIQHQDGIGLQFLQCDHSVFQGKIRFICHKYIGKIMDDLYILRIGQP